MSNAYDEVLAFWFGEIDPKSWWIADPHFDRMVQARFGDVLIRAAKAELYEWRAMPRGRLAEVLVLDQFSRNVYRNSPLAFAQDSMALALSQEAIAAGSPAALALIERAFLYMPFMHSESKLIHERAVALFGEKGLEENFQFELKHKAIIDRFGRYPHRNKTLGRTSTPEEIDFLQQPGSSF
jgi:uncharacterized protein (DUF924 family)